MSGSVIGSENQANGRKWLDLFARPHWQWILLGWLAAGVLLVMAIPLNLGGHVERVAKIFLNLNPKDLLGQGGVSFLIVLLAGGIIGVGLYVLASLLAAWQPAPGPMPRRAPARRWSWLVYTLPMLLTWTIYLLAFYPAMLSPDSTHVWLQVQTGVFDNAHPLVYLIAVWLLTRVWNSPTMIAVVQIVLLSLLVAWALGWLRKRGLPNWAAWLVSVLFAAAPGNGAMVVTLWKDIPYGMAVLAFSLLVLQISLDPRASLAKRSTGLLLGLAAAAVGLLRYNGLVIAPLVFAVLALIYRRHWKVFAVAMAVFVAGWWLVETPLDRALDVKKTSAVSGSLAMHHIAAHLHYQSPISAEDQATLERIMALDEWHYYCYMSNPVLFNPARDQQAMLDSLSKLNVIALRLLVEDPTVDINQTFCAGSIVYRVLQPYDGYLYAAAIAPDGLGSGTYVDPNNYGIVEAPILPGLNRWLIHTFESTRNGPFSWFFWRPAFYLYLFLFCGAVFAMRARTWRAGLYLLPGAVHSAVLFAVSISQAFRYQYPIYLLALFSLALLALPCPTASREG